MIRPLLLAAIVAVFAPPASSLRAEDGAAPAEKAPVAPVALATDAAAVRALVGKTATIEGRITRVGTTTAGGITFLNFAGDSRFVAVVFQSNYAAFPGGFDQYRGATVRVTGPLALYKEETPQIVLETPGQIEIVTPAPTAVADPPTN